MRLIDELSRIAEPGGEGAVERLHRNERLNSLPEDFLRDLRHRITSRLLTEYPDPAPLYGRLCRQLGLPQEMLLLTNGSDAALKAVYQAYVSPSDVVVFPEPSYAMYGVYAQMFGAAAATVPYDRELNLPIDLLLGSLRPGVCMILLANPNQPTGTLLEPQLLREVIERAHGVGALVVVDEAYYPFSGFTIVPWLEEHPNLVVLRTFSKAAGLAGLRVGYVAAHPEVITALFKVRSVHDVNALAVTCACLVLDHPSLVSEYVEEVRAGSRTLSQGAGRLACVALPTHTNFQLLRLPSDHEPLEVMRALQEAGFLVRGGYDAPGLQRCIRVTLGPPPLMERFLSALDLVLEQLRNASPLPGRRSARRSPSHWSRSQALHNYYASHRRSPAHLYESERRFLPWLLQEDSSVLDAGCAAGGFWDIVHGLRPGIRYKGIDLAEGLAKLARRLHPEADFCVVDVASGIPFADAAFELVMALGWLHWEPRYVPALRELWRVTQRHLLYDLRLTTVAQTLHGSQRLEFEGASWDGSTVPYLVRPWREALDSALALQPRPSRILAFGYEGPPAPSVRGISDPVGFSALVLEKGARRDTRTSLYADWPYPSELADAPALEVRGPRELEDVLGSLKGRSFGGT